MYLLDVGFFARVAVNKRKRRNDLKSKHVTSETTLTKSP
jgi:hypothetical protein